MAFLLKRLPMLYHSHSCVQNETFTVLSHSLYWQGYTDMACIQHEAGSLTLGYHHENSLKSIATIWY